jgi:ADP-ribosylation factor GTPase-activating protein 2/3
LGAAKTKPIDFAEAERKAIEEAERIKQLGYDREREEKEEKARKEAEALKRAQELGSRAAATTTTTRATTNGGNKFNADPQKSAAFPRLGFGAIPGARAASVVAPTTSKTNSGSIEDDSPTTARDKFGNQKGISSDMYFGRNSYDPDTVREAQTRLQSFQGATAISSNQYFQRDDEDEERGRLGGGHDGSLLGDGSSLAGLESAARDAVAKVLSNPDVQNMGETIRTGALKLSDYLASMSER